MPLVSLASEPPLSSSSQGNACAHTSTDTPDPNIGNPNPNPATSIPVVRLDVDAVSDVLAAGLAVALVGHVLFLKSQVPLPVMQLARMAEKQGTIRNEDDCGTSPGPRVVLGKGRVSRAVKSRTELLASFDTLASHLSTTFTALSTAFAGALNHGGEGEGGQGGGSARAYLAILVGPSVGSAKAKVVFAVDGLEVRVWGERESDVEEGDDEEGGEDEDEGGEEGEEGESEQGESEEGEEEDEEQEREEEATPPPLSPSPSPSPEPYMTHAQQQQTLFSAERLLSRTLANADAHGYGLNSDLGKLRIHSLILMRVLYASLPLAAPTQTHILIRAPRRFAHPAWVPRQNVAGLMESALKEFLEESRNACGDKDQGRKRRVEGVWVVCRGAADKSEGEEPEREEDEMIWWSWDGKLVGFSDW